MPKEQLRSKPSVGLCSEKNVIFTIVKPCKKCVSRNLTVS